MATGNLEPYPVRDPIVKTSRKAADVLVRYEEQVVQQRLDESPQRVQAAEVLTNIAASDVGTLGGDQSAGLYRVTAYREVTTQDPVSSSLALVISWTHNGKALNKTLAAFGAAPQTIFDTAVDVIAVQIDPGTPISYTLTYASNTPALARFACTMSAELLQAIE